MAEVSELAQPHGGNIIGAYNYLAPECLADEEVGHRADVYALACVLSECLTEMPPYRADRVEQLIAAHLRGPAPRPSHLRPEWVSSRLDAVVAKGMAQLPEERYCSAGELGAAAHDALTESEQHEEAAILRQGNNENLIAKSGNFETGAGASGAQPRRVGAELPQVPEPPDDPPAPPLLPKLAPEQVRQAVPPALGGDAADHRAHPPTAEVGGWGSPPWAAFDISEALRSGSSAFDTADLVKTPGDKRKFLPIAGAVAITLVVLIAVAGLLNYSRHSSASHHASPAPETTRQIVLPFNGIHFRLSPGGEAVDDAGTVYVTNQGLFGRVVSLAAGSSAPMVEAFRGLYEPQGVAVDSAGTIYVTDFNSRVVMLAARSGGQVELPFTDLDFPEGLAVDGRGGVYVADRGNNRVVMLPAGSTSQVELPFNGLKNPEGVAVGPAGG